jgi:hypothetical protein
MFRGNCYTSMYVAEKVVDGVQEWIEKGKSKDGIKKNNIDNFYTTRLLCKLELYIK